nr:MAG TPA: hypothetical protein [Caudoviricetes sp.]DAJ25940.1 MAG TPA: hypothetical protein [Caudoviricetes sp.]DAS92978.1 MAG TPA: hypothetical protein [Caudoviricetes sp.]
MVSKPRRFHLQSYLFKYHLVAQYAISTRPEMYLSSHAAY